MTTKIALILGATRGIGRALVSLLKQDLGDRGTVYFTARSEADARRVEAEFLTEGLEVGGLILDLAEPESPARLAAEIMKRHDGLDFLVQNGAVMPRPGIPAAEDARPMIEANSHGTLRVLRAFAPLMRENGHMLIVASKFGVLSFLPEHLADRFRAAEGDPDAVNAIMDDYVRAAEAGIAEAEGWPDWVNIPSKVGQVAVTRAFAHCALSHGLLAPGVTINSANPGVALTDATAGFMDTVFKGREVQTPQEAAAGLLLALGDNRLNGELIEHGKVLPFD
ncbi:SDR family NAD(P)-dependent oxidoreductase [Aquisediminimonas profunda]|uniref:SDR family NAD(P)-dependent oxidoreductase n=1 Tax=Aquisediminimonas profunda TaxID=1550733 RepID=UPI001C62DFBF|nr:SDR family oxidoreductase [Aquisediminimonas profunda]